VTEDGDVFAARDGDGEREKRVKKVKGDGAYVKRAFLVQGRVVVRMYDEMGLAAVVCGTVWLPYFCTQLSLLRVWLGMTGDVSNSNYAQGDDDE
jgi:hypothetical protein